MKFGDTPLDDAEGAILAHSLRLDGQSFKKGRALTRDDIAALRAAGLSSVVATRLEPGDLGENAAAQRIAEACQGRNVAAGDAFTGRSNLTATRDGLLVVDAARIDRLNRVDEAITLSTLPPYTPVRSGQMVATVKIIPFGIDGALVDRSADIAREAPDMIRVAAWRPVTVGLVQTRLAGFRENLAEKAVDATRARLAESGAKLDHDVRCGHNDAEVVDALVRLRNAGCDIALVLGASAVADRRDVVPAAIEHAGGRIEHFGMPVDPGQLTLLAKLGGMHVIGIPGSARSPRLHGFDWILQRLIADIEVTGDMLTGMGVGGLLKEIPSRPMPREEASTAAPAPRIAALVLAAGQSRRMGRVNKLLAEIEGTPMVVRTVEAVLAASVAPVVVVLGHEANRVRAAIASRPVNFVVNPDYETGLASSLRHGLAALPAEIDGALICLGDMPRVSSTHIEKLIEAFDPAGGRGICVPTFNGRRGNPVLWDRRYFAQMAEVAGDVGARHLISAHEDAVYEVEMPDGGVLLDLDTPEALATHAANTAAEG